MDYFNKMDGAGYVRASLLGMSQGISPIHDPLRLHPALHGVAQQVSEANKEAGTLMRPLTDYGPLPFMGFAPHFLHHTLDHRLPIPSAFHPLGHKPVSGAGLAAPTPCSSASIHSSAFSPLPVKNTKVEVETSISVPASSSTIFSPGMLSIDTRNALFGGLSPPGMASNVGVGEDRRDSPSPRGSHGSRDSPGHARDADTPNSTGEDGRGRKLRPGESWCPVCSTPIRSTEYESHLSLEIEKLAQLLSPDRTNNNGVPRSSPNSGPMMHSPMSPATGSRGRDPGWDTFERVRSNRLNRMRTKRKRPCRVEELSCPVCSDRSIAPEDFNQHMEQCIRRGPLAQLPPLTSGLYPPPRSEGGLSLPPRCGGSAGGPEDEVVDVEGDGPMDDFQWPGGRTIRGVTRPLSAAADSQRDDNSSSADKERQQQNLRISQQNSNDNSVADGGGGGGGGGGIVGRDGGGSGGNGGAMEDADREMEEIKEKCNNNGEVVNHNTKQLYSCVVCRSDYKRPAVSVVCWHVLCEGCWSTTLGVKTECPQCSSTMASEDVRLIHL